MSRFCKCCVLCAMICATFVGCGESVEPAPELTKDLKAQIKAEAEQVEVDEMMQKRIAEGKFEG